MIKVGDMVRIKQWPQMAPGRVFHVDDYRHHTELGDSGYRVIGVRWPSGRGDGIITPLTRWTYYYEKSLRLAQCAQGEG